MLRNKADGAAVTAVKRDIDVGRQQYVALEKKCAELAKGAQAEAMWTRIKEMLGNKADIDYVDEANDIAAARESRELNSLKKKFNDLLNFLHSVPGIGGDAPPDL